ncbi:MAG: LuxR C-terminal-related transcriptional regulator [Tannerellaceae bacterium]|nr:LuxR C-terminal-related transcriptional regulator [Tannerellaceae bacterium]
MPYYFSKYLYEGLSPKEIAQELGISVNTVRVQIKIAFDKIRNEVGPLAYLILFSLLAK